MSLTINLIGFFLLFLKITQKYLSQNGWIIFLGRLKNEMNSLAKVLNLRVNSHEYIHIILYQKSFHS